jgi:predicted nucleic acid-binding protein
MGWVDSLQGQVVGCDTMPFIYYIEEHPHYLDVVDPFFDAIELGRLTVVTSIITLLEVLVHPFRDGDTKLVQKYRDILFESKGVETQLLTQKIAEEAARLRAIHKLRTPDSIQMATAITEGASYFLTNDKVLPSLPQLKILSLTSLANDQQASL